MIDVVGVGLLVDLVWLSILVFWVGCWYVWVELFRLLRVCLDWLCCLWLLWLLG